MDESPVSDDILQSDFTLLATT